jgi:hypothetical protein
MVIARTSCWKLPPSMFAVLIGCRRCRAPQFQQPECAQSHSSVAFTVPRGAPYDLTHFKHADGRANLPATIEQEGGAYVRYL